MTDFVSRFDPQRGDHRAQMHIWLIALAREVTPGSLKFSMNPFASAKAVGWIPQNCRNKKQGFVYLVDLARQGFGYVPKDNVKKQYEALTGDKPPQPSKKAGKK